MSARSGTLPFTAGIALPRGQVSQRQNLTAEGRGLHSFQAIVKTRWHDGSIKFAVVSGLIGFQPGSEHSIRIDGGDPKPGGAPVTVAQLVATGVSASIVHDASGSVRWNENDWNRPFLTWISGPQMSSWIYRKPVGQDQHLVAWMEVRLYRDGSVEFLPWLENGYLMRPEPGERTGRAGFYVNDDLRFAGELNLANHTRAVLATGNALSHWLGEDPAVSVRHDMGMLQASGLVPAYRGVTSAGSKLLARLATSYQPLARHDFPSTMGAAGYDPSIGPLPEWDVLYITSDGDPRAWKAVQINGYAAGRYGYHFRDETTHRAPILANYPNLALGTNNGIPGTGSSSKGLTTPNASGARPPAFTNSHMPAIGYMAYLVTGRWYFLDEMQLLASTMLLKQVDSARRFGEGIIQSSSGANTTRGAAWTLRSLAHAAASTPDDDTDLKGAYAANIAHNIDWYHTRYIETTNNPLGLVRPTSDYEPKTGILESASWMEDFLTWAFGNLKTLELADPGRSKKLDEFLDWKYRSIIGRLGPNARGHWPFRGAAPYVVPYAPTEDPDWIKGTGPWYRDWGDAYLATKQPVYEPGNTLLGAYIDDTGLATSYWGNLQPAIAYAVEHESPGALEAYRRMTGAENWAKAVRGFDTMTPVWSVRPRNLPR